VNKVTEEVQNTDGVRRDAANNTSAGSTGTTNPEAVTNSAPTIAVEVIAEPQGA
jgi:hypothetical protein